jgi:predicted outer membrane protein
VSDISVRASERAWRLLEHEHMRLGPIAACMLSVVVTSCSGDPEVPDGTAGRVRPQCPSGTSATQAPIDTGIGPIKGVATFRTPSAVRVAIALSESALAQAELAETRAVATEVKSYAKLVIEERKTQLARLQTLAERAKTVRDDPTPVLLRTEADYMRLELEKIERTGFDLPFMTAEITTEARILGLLDASLLPSVSQAMVTPGATGLEQELDRELRAMRAALEERIVHALRVQGVLRAAYEGVGAAGDGLDGSSGGRGPAIPQ